MESDQSDACIFKLEEDFLPHLSPEVEEGFMEPSGSEPYRFDLLVQCSDSAMPEAGAAEAVVKEWIKFLSVKKCYQHH